MKRVLFRCDDAGSCISADLATRRCVDEGIGRNCSVMVPGPTFDHAASVLRGVPAAVGLHLVLNAEWTKVKWGPVAPLESVPSLVEPDGNFTQNPGILHQRGFSVDEAMTEFRAQLAKLRAAGLNPVYVDEHMGVCWLPGLRDAVAPWAEAEGLGYRPDLSGLPVARDESVPLSQRILAAVDAAPDGDYLFVVHPGADAEDMRAFDHPGLEPGQVAQERAADTALYCDPHLRQGLEARGVVLARYDDLA